MNVWLCLHREFHVCMYVCMYVRNYLAVYFFFQTILPANENIAIGIYVCLSVVSIIASLLLPIETRGRPMKVRKEDNKDCYNVSIP